MAVGQLIIAEGLAILTPLIMIEKEFNRTLFINMNML